MAEHEPIPTQQVPPEEPRGVERWSLKRHAAEFAVAVVAATSLLPGATEISHKPFNIFDFEMDKFAGEYMVLIGALWGVTHIAVSAIQKHINQNLS